MSDAYEITTSKLNEKGVAVKSGKNKKKKQNKNDVSLASTSDKGKIKPAKTDLRVAPNAFKKIYGEYNSYFGISSYADTVVFTQNPEHKKSIWYCSMPDLNEKACAILAAMWATYGTEEMVDALYPYNLWGNNGTLSPKVIFKALNDYIATPGFKSLIKSGAIKFDDSESYLILAKKVNGEANFNLFQTPITQLKDNLATPFVFAATEGYVEAHIWVRADYVDQYLLAYLEKKKSMGTT